MNQERAWEILQKGHSVFLTGPAGSGKTYLLRRYIRHLREKKIRVAVTASTGIAATHLGGVTIHSWSGMGIRDRLSDQELRDLRTKFYLKHNFSQTEVLIIDEVSMLHARQLDLLDRICRLFKKPFVPFGGLQVIFSGDFFQLPPVVKSGNDFGGPQQESQAAPEELKFASDSNVWSNMNLKVCYLDQQFRQKDPQLSGVLGDIRTAQVTKKTRQLLESRLGQAVEGAGPVKPTRLFTHNADVDRLNWQELAKLPESAKAYLMREEGRPNPVEMLKRNCLAPERLVLKKGAAVMFVKNNFERGYVNGTLGTVTGFEENRLPIVRTFSGEKITVAPETWELEEPDRRGKMKTKAQLGQLPLRLAWAITVHKSQGMSLDAAEMDLAKCFEYGMGYVALSRVRTLAGIKLLGLNERALEINPRIHELDQELQKASKKNER